MGASVFPVLGRTKTKYSILWQDEENEWITIRSDEELVIALTEMAGPVYKLHVQFTTDEDNVKSGSIFDLMEDITRIEGDIEEGLKEGKLHPGVTCDGCEKPVIGFRYKCVQCPDYDLCERCEAKRMHPGHNMMRIAAPEGIWPQHFFRRLNKMHDRINKRAASASTSAEAREDEEEELSTEDLPRVPPFGCGRGRPHGRGRGGPHGRGRFGNGGRFGTGGAFPPGCGQKWFEAMMKGWTGEGQYPGANFHEQHANMAKSAHDAAHQAAQAAAASVAAASHAAAGSHAAFNAANGGYPNPNNSSNQTEGQQTGPPRSQSLDQMFQGNTEFLANVGNMVAAALDPFGINVQVDVEAPNGQRTTCQTTNSSMTTSSESSEGQKDENQEKESTESVSNPEEAASQKKENISEEVSAKEENVPTSVTIQKDDSDDDEFEFLSRSPEAKSPTPPEGKEINIPIEVEQNINNNEPKLESQKGEPSKNTPSAPAKLSEEGGARNVPITVQDQPAKVYYAAPNGGPLYPELPKNEPSPSVSTNGAAASVQEQDSARPKETIGVAKHRDPKIQVALQAMLNMGFTNDGGWLTQLLEAKDGDIGKTLDVLQPVNAKSTRK